MHPFLNIATNAARKAAQLIVRALDDLKTLKIDQKGLYDYVTNVDKEAEAIIIEIIQKAYPDHGILGEETGRHEGNEYTWIIDPLDGTKNFIRGIPFFCISIAVMYQNRLEHALVYDPLRDELFTATRGKGAKLNNYKMRVSDTSKIQGIVVGTAIPTFDKTYQSLYLKHFNELFPELSGIRHMGCAVLGLTYVAAGRLDAYWEMGLKPWDMAAAALLVREAGGMVLDLDSSDNFMESGNILAANPKLVRELMPYLDLRKN